MKLKIKEGMSERKSGMVQVRGGFSDTTGIAPCNTLLQVDEFDGRSRILMSNMLFEVLETILDNPHRFFSLHIPYDFQNNFCKSIVNDVFCERTASSRGAQFDWRGVYERIHDVIADAVYNEVLDVIEYSCRWFENRIEVYHGYFFKRFNKLFEREYIGYRFVDGRIISITDEQEINTIETACNNPYDGCRVQIQKAVGFLSDRENPDYKNSIKESISAVESLCQIVTGNKKATLGDALKLLEGEKKIHPALKGAFTKLYGYTSDEGGIRHAEGLLESDVTFEEAKFMLVACSAFINYMIAEQGKGSN